MSTSLRGLATCLCLVSTMACGSDRITTREPDLGTTLTVTVAASRDAPDRRSWTLTCDPAGGSHPEPAAACAALARARDPFAPVPRDRICTEIYGGPAVATLRGTYRGQPVDATYTRTDGCEISRWENLGPVLPGPVPGQPTPPAEPLPTGPAPTGTASPS